MPDSDRMTISAKPTIQARSDQGTVVLEIRGRGNDLLDQGQDSLTETIRQALHAALSPSGVPLRRLHFRTGRTDALSGDGGLGDAEMLGRARLGAEPG
jgi:hypothetical protein